MASTAGRKSKVKSQKSKRRQYRLFNDLEWLVYLRRFVLVKVSISGNWELFANSPFPAKERKFNNLQFWLNVEWYVTLSLTHPTFLLLHFI